MLRLREMASVPFTPTQGKPHFWLVHCEGETPTHPASPCVSLTRPSPLIIHWGWEKNTRGLWVARGGLGLLGVIYASSIVKLERIKRRRSAHGGGKLAKGIIE
ncbi:hypothetical protein E2C01_052482 [Portunus trituberculatus]|uniref:Uncharacterized protein n=1 Tax=Portunus trituberculatus TaxID=210409 RepID=A0A5B7GMK3_PORTR|nr:hypothetical protein [Portunus trituberculatus]